MKKLLSVIVAVLSLVPFVFAVPASALSTCEIGYTGPDSNNQCTSQTTYVCTVSNTNNVEIKNDNNQVVASGNVSNSGNTQTGGATSGQVTNSSGIIFSVSITNGGVEASTCVAKVTVPAKETPATPVTPTTPVQPLATGAGAATALPYTSGNSFGLILLMVVAALGTLAAASYVAVGIYRHLRAS